MTIDILCKVVDNYGDIGVAYRLARALAELDPGLRLRLVVDGLSAFRTLAPGLDPTREVQPFSGWTVLRWEPTAETIASVYGKDPPRFVVECFACGKPDWFEALAFGDGEAPGAAGRGTPRLAGESAPGETVILNLEYLTAEPYAREFHLLRAATRSPRVRKYFFMPGFEEGTAGLVLDRRFCASRERFLHPARRGQARLEAAAAAGLALEPGDEGRFWVSVFSYERDYGRVVADLAAFSAGSRLGTTDQGASGHGTPRGGRVGPARPVLALVAAGRSQDCFLRAWEAAGRPFPAFALPFLPQELWDDLLLASDFAIVRGEESLARAALSGRPFLWQAYVQEEGHQLVKVRALIERMRASFPAGDFAPLEALFLAFNDRLADAPETAGSERLLPVLARWDELRTGFVRFSGQLTALGNLAEHLLTFFSSSCKMR